ncbi:putative transporter [Planctomycetes bacterium Pan216]|uniref:Putative transporter n=2 Tax=Kolteria novifilia TaxID=2527975 RepID=A0A518B8G0_9BACT|nr:putative transporter [Planctomycetes bacterium Pan216]
MSTRAALAELQTTFFGIDKPWGILLAGCIVLTYTVIGGMWSVTVTDAVQVLFVIGGLIILGVVTFAEFGDGNPVAGLGNVLASTPPERLTLLPKPGTEEILGWVAIWTSGILGCLPGQDLMQRVFSARSGRGAAAACVLAGVAYISVGFIPVSLGLAAHLRFPDNVEGSILPILADQFLSPFVAVIFLLSLVSIISNNLLPRWLNREAIESSKLRMVTIDRLVVCAVVIAAISLAFSGRSIFELLEQTLSLLLVALVVPLVMGVYGKPRGELSAILAMLFGAVVWFGWSLGQDLIAAPEMLDSDQETGIVSRLVAIPAALVGLASSFLGYVVGQAFHRRKDVHP